MIIKHSHQDATRNVQVAEDKLSASNRSAPRELSQDELKAVAGGPEGVVGDGVNPP